MSSHTEVTISNQDADDIGVLLHSGVTLSGTVKLEGGDIESLIPRGSPSRLDTPLDVNTLIQAAVNSAIGVPAPNARPSIDLGNLRYGLFQEDGTFSKIVDIPPSQYYLNVALLPNGVYVKSASLNGADVLHTPLDLTKGGGELNLMLSMEAAEIAGSLINEKGKSLENALVTLWLSTAELGIATKGIRNTVTDQNGSFRFRNLPPSQYHLAAWDDVDESPLVNFEFLSRFNPEATEIKLAAGEHAAVNPKIITVEAVAAQIAKLP